MLEADNRAKERHYRAWELINAARGSTVSSSAVTALQDLSKDGVSLAAAPLEKAYLPAVDLRGANLEGADLQNADLRGADLRGADLGPSFRSALFQPPRIRRSANLQSADLRGADLKGARNLTQEQINGAEGDDRTVLPDGLTRPAHWLRFKRNKEQSGDGTTGQ